MADGVARFRSAHHFESYLGLVPREHTSDSEPRRGRITKVGDRHVRGLLVQAAWCIVRSKTAEVAHLRAWHARLAARRGKQVAIVALARRIAGILYAMLRDSTSYRPPLAEKEAA